MVTDPGKKFDAQFTGIGIGDFGYTRKQAIKHFLPPSNLGLVGSWRYWYGLGWRCIRVEIRALPR